MSERTVTLAPNEILINGRVHTLVEGFDTWSYTKRVPLLSQSQRPILSLYYKRGWVVDLIELKSGFAVNHNRQMHYPNLPAVIEAYSACWAVQCEEQETTRRRLVQWCQRGPTVATVTVALTGEEMDLFERLVHEQGTDAEALATQAVRDFIRRHIVARAS